MSDKQGKKRGSRTGSPDFPKCGTGLPATTAPHRGTAVVMSKVADALTAAMLADPQHELYAQALAAGSSYVEAYRQAGYASDTGNAWRLAQTPEVAHRIRMLRTAAAEHRVCSIAARMALLDDMVSANPEELTRVVVRPCVGCWEDAPLALAMGRALAGHAGMPDTDKPRHDCQRCSGDGVSRVVLTPTAELSAGARALFKSARQNAKGEIIVETHDRLAALAELNKMQDGSIAATRSMSLNVNSYIPAAREVTSIEELNRLLESFKE